jgi:hypothetical protein
MGENMTPSLQRGCHYLRFPRASVEAAGACQPSPQMLLPDRARTKACGMAAPDLDRFIEEYHQALDAFFGGDPENRHAEMSASRRSATLWP